MRDGYYLSTYITVDEYLHVFKVTTRHDNSIGLFYKENDNVTLVHYWELERITGFKHHGIAFLNTEHAFEFINDLLATYNLTIDDMVEIWGSPKISTTDDYHSVPELPEYAYHGIWHLFSGIMLNTDVFHNEQMLSFAVDGGPEFFIDEASEEHVKYFYPGCYVNKGEITYFPAYSPGLLWGYGSLRYGMREGTLMALGSAIEFTIEKNYMRDCLFVLSYESKVESSKALHLYFNELEDDFSKLPSTELNQEFTYEENKIAFVMNIIQHVSKEIMAVNVNNALEKFAIRPEDTTLSVTGGFALNCPTNSFLMNEYKFKDFIAPPCVNDTGMSLGCALYAFYKKMGKFNFNFAHAYYGDQDDTLDKILDNYSEFVKSENEMDEKQFVSDILSSPVVWFNNRSEVGPRALGNRSLLADPRNLQSKEKLNEIKEREWWRPVAPLIMEEHLHEWFSDDISSPYMLQTSKIRDDQALKVPAILHMDQSSRIQTVNRNDNQAIYNLLTIFKKETGVPILCNTSLNDKGEPIINRLEEAINFALRKKIKVVYFNKTRIELYNFEKFQENSPHVRLKSPFSKENRLTKMIEKQFNPFNLHINYFDLVTIFPNVFPILKQGLEKEVIEALREGGSEVGVSKYINDFLDGICSVHSI